MRQVTIIKTLLKFDELTPEQKKKVIEKHRAFNVDSEHWSEYLTEQLKEKLKKLGFYDIKVYWTGFSSQGDGASFEAKHNRGRIYHQGFYYHDNTMYCDESETLLKVGQRIARKFYKDLETEYDYLTSDESIIESLKINDYEFDSETLKISG